jgi:hypothetical protein
MCLSPSQLAGWPLRCRAPGGSGPASSAASPRTRSTRHHARLRAAATMAPSASGGQPPARLTRTRVTVTATVRVCPGRGGTLRRRVGRWASPMPSNCPALKRVRPLAAFTWHGPSHLQFNSRRSASLFQVSAAGEYTTNKSESGRFFNFFIRRAAPMSRIGR